MVVIVGKSGSGKTTLANALVAIGYKKVVTYTTRKPRIGEKNGILISLHRRRRLYLL